MECCRSRKRRPPCRPPPNARRPMGLDTQAVAPGPGRRHAGRRHRRLHRRRQDRPTRRGRHHPHPAHLRRRRGGVAGRRGGAGRPARPRHPRPGTPLTSGDRVTVSYGRPVALTVDGSRRQVWTTARTVDGVLYRLGVRADSARLSTSRSAAVARRGLDLEVRTERSVTVRADGRVHRLRTTAATVRQAVRQAGLTLRGEDSTSVPEDDVPRDGQSISVLRIVRTQRTLDRPIRYRTVRRTDPTVTGAPRPYARRDGRVSGGSPTWCAPSTGSPTGRAPCGQR